jgi:serine/threonine protein phosphatase PrpC
MTSDATEQLPQGITVSLVCMTDKGLTRPGNEDAFIIADLRSGKITMTSVELFNITIGECGLLMAVADGVGGSQAGEVASRLAVEQLVRRLTALSQANTIVERLRDGIKSSHRAIRHASLEKPSYQGMGSTMTVALIHQGQAFIGQVGDSRCYLIRAGRVQQITKDQSLAQALIDIGQLTEEQAAHSPQRHVILQALGAQEEVEPEVSAVKLVRGDHIALCSDYLMQKVSKSELADTVREAKSLNDACARLVALANERGGEDNITLILAQFDGAALPETAEAMDQSIQNEHL